MRSLRIEENHAHAYMIYEPTDLRHFWALLRSFIEAKKNKTLSLTTHLPFEIQHPDEFSTLQQDVAKGFLYYGEFLKHIFHVPLYWENCPIFNVGTWDLQNGQTDWSRIPKSISLCLDTGHLLMGAKSQSEAKERIAQVLQTRGKQVKHLHIHENDLVHDQHLDPRKRNKKERIITKDLLEKLQGNRTYIFEKPS